MNRRWKKITAISGIAIASAAATLGLSQNPFFKELSLKAQDYHFVLRGKQPVRDIAIIGIDQATLYRKRKKIGLE